MAIAPVRAEDFIDSIGAVAHLGAANGAARSQAVVGAFDCLGISNVRTTLSAALVQPGSVADKLAQAGVQFDVLLGGARPLAETLGNAALFAKRHVGAITALEGPNEINNWPITFNGMGGVAAGVAFMGAMGAGARATFKFQTTVDHAILLQGDLNGDARADFAIMLAGLAHPLSADACIF